MTSSIQRKKTSNVVTQPLPQPKSKSLSVTGQLYQTITDGFKWALRNPVKALIGVTVLTERSLLPKVSASISGITIGSGTSITPAGNLTFSTIPSILEEKIVYRGGDSHSDESSHIFFRSEAGVINESPSLDTWRLSDDPPMLGYGTRDFIISKQENEIVRQFATPPRNSRRCGPTIGFLSLPFLSNDRGLIGGVQSQRISFSTIVHRIWTENEAGNLRQFHTTLDKPQLFRPAYAASSSGNSVLMFGGSEQGISVLLKNTTGSFKFRIAEPSTVNTPSVDAVALPDGSFLLAWGQDLGASAAYYMKKLFANGSFTGNSRLGDYKQSVSDAPPYIRASLGLYNGTSEATVGITFHSAESATNRTQSYVTVCDDDIQCTPVQPLGPLVDNDDDVGYLGQEYPDISFVRADELYQVVTHENETIVLRNIEVDLV